MYYRNNVIQYPKEMYTVPPQFGETIFIDKWGPRLLDNSPRGLKTPAHLYPWLFRDEKLPPETVNLDKWYPEMLLFNPRINPVVNQRHYPTLFLTRCYPIHTFLSKNSTTHTFLSKNTTSYTYPSKNSTVHTFEVKVSANC